VLLYYTEFNLA